MGLLLMARILLVSGHGYNDVGAVGNNTNERDFIRKYITPNVARHIKDMGHTVEIYNPKWDMFQDTRAGYGVYRYRGQNIKIVEFHLDSAGAGATGGHVIISKGLKADKTDQDISKAIEKHVGLRGGVGIHGRNDLLNLNVCRELGLNYRLVELGFITNANDMRKIRNNLTSYTRDIAGAIIGKDLPKQKTNKDLKGWQVNKHGTWYKKERGTFTVGVNEIVARNGSPFLTAKINGVVKKGQSIMYDEVCLQDGHVWIGYKLNNGKREYLPIRTWDKVRPPHHSVGRLWGSIR